jgi:CBS domain-containing protein
LLSAALTAAVYAAEDGFQKLPIHWMWWPAIGGLVIGIGGLVFPQALGVGYDTIGALIQGEVPKSTIAGILIVKSIIWAVALGSGTSGGVLAPLLMMGGALGGLEAGFLPHEGAGFWPLISMGAILGGTMRSPFTGIVFAIELTHDLNVLLPLLVANALAYTVSVLLLKRSILTEKVSRRGFHLSREYAVDPLEVLFAREVMETNVTAFTEYTPCGAAVRAIPAQPNQALYPVLKEENNLAGVVTRNDIRNLAAEGVEGKPVGTVLRRKPVVAYAGEPLRVIVYRMASSGFTQMPVLEEPGKNRLVGMISLEGLLRARAHNLSEERDREQVIRIRLPFGLLTANEDREESHRANR